MWLLVAVLVLVILVWYGNARSNDSRQRNAGAFEYEDPDGISVWIVNFVKGRLFYLWRAPDPDPTGPNRDKEYQLRRDGLGAWALRLTDESWARAVQQARADTKSLIPVLAERATGELDEFGDAPEWKPSPAALTAMIESRYQTYADVFGIRLKP